MITMSLSIDHAQLKALGFEALFLGIYLATLFPCFKALLWRNDSFVHFQSIRWIMLTVCLLFATLNIMDFSVEFYHVFQAFAVSSELEGAVAEFSKMSDWTNVMMVMNVWLSIGSLANTHSDSG